MKEVFIKKYWDDENVLFYLHFQNDTAFRQIEITSNNKILLTSQHPRSGNSMLYDQSLKDLDLQKSDFITELEFNRIWKGN